MKKISQLSGVALYKKQHGFYASAYKEGDTPWSDTGKPSPFIVDSVNKLKKNLKIKRALDLGCGEGRNTLFLRQQGMQAMGIEYQNKALHKAAGRHLRDIFYIRGDIFRIPVKAGSFDLLVDCGVFHHIRRKDTSLYLNLLSSLLVKGGYLMLICFASDFKHANGRVYERGFLVHKNHYDRFSSKEEIRGLFKKDFKILSLKKDKDGFLNVLMRRY